jgi:bifunctional non-homologous end joining protein LigD
MLAKPIPPMMATPAATLPSGPDWSYEVKWDGYRAQAVKRGNTVSLASRNLKNITRQYPSVVHSVAGLKARDVLLDGEIVALGPDGRPSFQALHHVDLQNVSIVYYAFDLLHLDGRDLLREPLDARRNALRQVVSGSSVLLSDALPGTPAQIADAVRGLGLEGIVAKRRKSIYIPGRRADSWVKVRFAQHQELVIGGYKPANGSFDSIIVGYFDGKKLMAAGKVRNGFTPHLRSQLLGVMRPLTTKKCPFVNLPSSRSSHWGEGITAAEMLELVWLKPRLVAEVSFTEWTRDGSLRHAAYVGLRDDKRPTDVHRDDFSRRT